MAVSRSGRVFFFFSKLLPLAVLPVGLVCLLLVVALVSLRRKGRWVWAALWGALAVLVGAGNGFVPTMLTYVLERRVPPLAPAAKADAIVVLGGVTGPALPPRNVVHIYAGADRVTYAAKLYKEGRAPLVIVSGARPSLDPAGLVPEADDMAELLESFGVPRQAIVEERSSRNTAENASGVLGVMRARRLRRVILVTSAIHMPRAAMMLRELGIDLIPAPTGYEVTDEDLHPLREGLSGFVLACMPTAEHLDGTSYALKEYLALAFYKLKARLAGADGGAGHG